MKKLLLAIPMIICLAACFTEREENPGTATAQPTLAPTATPSPVPTKVPTPVPTEEPEEAHEYIIDHAIKQAVGDSGESIIIRILGESLGKKQGEDYDIIAIETMQISNSKGKFIQEIEVQRLPSGASKDNDYGLRLRDYSHDGYTDMYLRKNPGDNEEEAFYYWVWDNEAFRFVYDWRLKEEVTEDNLIEDSISQSIHEGMEPFTFRILGRWVEGYTKSDLEANILALQIIGNNGEMYQELSGFKTHPPSSEPSYGFKLADYNFDGYLDIALYYMGGGSRRNSPHIYWLWDNDKMMFVENIRLGDISFQSTITIDADEKMLRCFQRISGSGTLNEQYKFIDGEFVFVYSINKGVEENPDKKGEYLEYEKIQELINGEIITTKTYKEK